MPKKPTTRDNTPYDRKKVMEEITGRLVEGESLREICSSKGTPNKKTVLKWLGADPELATIMARAREMLGDVLDDDIHQVIKELRAGTLEPQAAQVIIRALQWRAGKLKPKVYGEKQTIDMNHGVQDPEEIVAQALAATKRLGLVLPVHLLGRAES